MSSSFIGTRVEWEKQGRGASEILSGICVRHVEPGTSNEEALNEFLDGFRSEFPEMRKMRWCSNYFRGALSTHTTDRYFVAVEQDTDSINPVYHIYAPNARGVYPA